MAVADPAASGVGASAAGGVAASAVKAIPSPEEDYQAALKADKAGETMEAARLFAKAAEAGHAAAQAELGDILKYASGYGEAFESFRKSAAQGYAPGQYGLGMMYGDKGKLQDFAEARKWITLAAEQGFMPAIQEMALIYIRGDMGIEKNSQSPDAVKWIKRAADMKDLAAIEALANAYRVGKYGLKIDLKQAEELDAKYKEIAGLNVKQKSKKSR